MINKLVLKNNLRQVRNEKGLSQANLAELVGFPETRSVPLKPDSAIQPPNWH